MTSSVDITVNEKFKEELTIDVEMPDHLAEHMVKLGKKVATELDYFSIGLKQVIMDKVTRETAKEDEKEKKDDAEDS
jgi:hypothetical protein